MKIMTIRVHPLTFSGYQSVPDKRFVFAEARVPEGQPGQLDVFTDEQEPQLRALFERPLVARNGSGETYAPWSKEALQQIVGVELPYLMMGATVLAEEQP